MNDRTESSQLNSWVAVVADEVLLSARALGRENPRPLRQVVRLFEVQDLWVGSARAVARPMLALDFVGAVEDELNKRGYIRSKRILT